MKKYYYNNSNEPTCFRTWILALETIGEDDIKWITAFDMSIRVDQPTHDIHSANGTTRKIVSKALYTVETTTDKQRDMLVLKYGNKAVMLVEEWVMPNSISTCVLKEIRV